MIPEETFANSIISKGKIRENLGDSIDIRVLRSRISLLTLSPGMTDMFFFAGKKLGVEYGKKVGKLSFEKSLEKYASIVKNTNLAIPELKPINPSEAVIRLRENAISYGMGELGAKICWFEAGFQSGMISSVTEGNFTSRETKCCANGDPHCEFVIKKSTVSGAFEEVFKGGR